MEFHFESISAVANGLASLFGQPSAGVNMYLTPPNSQGLACHRDDHCVHVCQLSGVKQRKVYPKLDHQLPRLYESVDYHNDLEGESPQVLRGSEYLMKEGDVLYIPRGGSFTRHILLMMVWGIKILGSPYISLLQLRLSLLSRGKAFVILHSINESRKRIYYHTSPVILFLGYECCGCELNASFSQAKWRCGSDISEGLFGWVGALWSPLIVEGKFNVNQKTTFSYLISRINSPSRFCDVVNYLEAAILKHEDPFQNFRWLLHFKDEETLIEGHYSNISQIGTENLYHLLIQHREEAEATYMKIKSKYCSEMFFEDVEGRYKLQLEKYRKARRHE